MHTSLNGTPVVCMWLTPVTDGRYLYLVVEIQEVEWLRRSTTG
jgi:hypothetical protein